jgi:hypothetical protein
MASFIQPIVIDEDPAPPWNWNPGQTFVTSFMLAQENQRAQQKAAQEAELAAILFPAKKAEAEFNMKKLAYESSLLEDSYKTKTEELEERRRIIKSNRTASGGGSGGSNSGGANSGATTQPQKRFQSQFGFGSRFSNPPQAAPTSKPTWRVVTPAQPQPGP